MRKILSFLVLMFIVSNVWALTASDPVMIIENTQLPICSTRTVAGINVYVTMESTGTSATMYIYPSSMSFVTQGGLYPGTTYFDLTEANKDTIAELVVFMNATTLGTLGVGNGLVATVINGCYDGNISTGLAVNHAGANVMSSTNTRTVAFDEPNAILGMSYTITAPDNGDCIFLTDGNVNATFASGTTYVYIYDGTLSSDTMLAWEKITTTTVDGVIDSAGPDFRGSANTAMRIDIVGTVPVTDCRMNLQYKKVPLTP